VSGDSDWKTSYSFCTCCDGYPKGMPRWRGTATGMARSGDVFCCKVDKTLGVMTIKGPREINMDRNLPDGNYYIYFNCSNLGVEIVVEDIVVTNE